MSLLTNKVPSLRKTLFHHVKHGYHCCILLFGTQSVLLETTESEKIERTTSFSVDPHVLHHVAPQFLLRRTTNTQQYTYILALIRHIHPSFYFLLSVCFTCFKPFTTPSSSLSSLFRLEFSDGNLLLCWQFLHNFQSFLVIFWWSESANLIAFLLSGFVVEALWE